MVITIILSKTATSDQSTQFTFSSVDMCIIDEDQSTASQALYDYLTSIHHPVTLDSYDNETLQDQLYYQNISYVLTIPEGFEQKLLAGKTDTLVQTSKRQDSLSGYFVDQQIDNYLQALSLRLMGGATLEEAITTTDDALVAAPEVNAVSFGKQSDGNGDAMYYFFQYLPYVFIMMLLEGLSPVLIAFHRKDLGDRINCSALRTQSKNTQIGLGCATYTLVIWLAFILLSVIMYGPSQIFSKNGLLCLLNSFVFALITTALTLLIGSLPLSSNVLNMISNVIGLGMSFLCGVFVPQWLLGDTVLAVSRFLPAYWYIRINNMLSGLSGEALSMNTYGMCIGIQLLFCAAIFCVYLAVNRQQKKTALA
jgi:ABC-2 type transport system permease protein